MLQMQFSKERITKPHQVNPLYVGVNILNHQKFLYVPSLFGQLKYCVSVRCQKTVTM
jgi:hypothetical protein